VVVFIINTLNIEFELNILINMRMCGSVYLQIHENVFNAKYNDLVL